MGGVISFCHRRCYVTETLWIKSPALKKLRQILIKEPDIFKVQMCVQKSFSGEINCDCRGAFWKETVNQSGSVGLCEHVMLTASES